MTPPALTRTSRTWLSYGLMGGYAYVAYGLGAITPDLRDELGVSATAAGLHASAFAVGMLVAGVGAPRATARVGRRVAAWGGSATMALGVLLVVAGPALGMTLTGALVAGTGGGVTIVTAGAALSSEHPRAFIEGNVAASLSSVAAPVLVAGAIAVGLGWEAGLVAAVVGLAVLAVALGRAPLGEAETGATEAQVRAPLPRAYWRRWLVLGGVVAAEFAIVYWAGAFLRETSDLGAASAVAGAGVFNVGMLAGRFAGSRMPVAVRDPAAVLQGGLLLGLAAVLAFWLAPGAGLKLVALLLAGLGAATTFPTGFALALAAAPGRADQASARVNLAGGSAILLAPLALAALGDLIGLTTAFGVVPALLVATLALARWADRLRLASAVDVRTHPHDPAPARTAR